ncbi:NAD(P)-dependent oxidoreductase [Ornithinimicrobium avium]|uniref:NAD(P)-dependent oxidoreductase n=1 Tax=Ornithinimicrobium avium TaxID=2283195 RepID=A0A345NM88_9MICO|nr:NAD(P)-dependent oxidoreductase [Ornithinimicrobium avium]AXH96146.1 NAD(P)-dependent oxidoreductase [Ornithinimicrobium avium]
MDTSERQTIGFLGLGPMGMPMAQALADGGFRVVAWNRTASKVGQLQERAPSVTAAHTPREVARGARTVVAMLPDLPQLEALLDGPDGLLVGWEGDGGRGGDGGSGGGEATGSQEPPLLVVTSTVSPVRVAELGSELRSRGVRLVDAPVSGGPGGAESRGLSVMVGGDPDDVERLAPVLAAMGSTVRHLGPLGAGSLTKACNQAVVGATLVALGEAVRLAQAGGLDVATVLEVLGGGLAGSAVLRQKGERYLTGDFSGGGNCRNQLKDHSIILEAGRRYGVRQPVSEVTRDLYAEVVERGGGDLDHTGVITVL